jgi:phage terminase small subunit
MPVLRNPKHEKFAHSIARGVSTLDAYTSAGYSAQGAYQSAHRLLKNAEVCSRIAEIQGNIAQAINEKTAISKSWVLEALRENYERAMQHEAVLDREGEPTGEYTYQGNVANKALELIGKELGMFVDRKDIRISKPIEELTDDELAGLVAVGTGIDSPSTSIN